MGLVIPNPKANGIGGPVVTDEIYFKSGGIGSHTGDTNLTTILSVQLPILGPNDSAVTEFLWSFSGAAGTRSVSVSVGSSLIHNKSGMASSVDSNQSKSFFSNNDSQSAQKIMHPTIGTVYEASGTPSYETTEDATAPLIMTFNAQLGNAADTIELTRVYVAVLRATE